ncbi:hypothetical protein [Treponema sp.]|uniref:hypothetical protein n=1 Tax=Treponema sp. TaxID=166 RepID=UPI0025F304E7|nr:hypothetical protein [Treponema sp.]MCR5218547.1 hypothetical protein [Treponema sp.]
MRRHPLRKFIGLLALTSVILIGIFVLQFKTQSVITRTIGSLHISIYQKENDQHQMVVKNQFEAEYKGIVFYCKEEEPVTSTSKSGEQVNLELTDWDADKKSLTFIFKDGTRLVFDTTKNEDSIFSIKLGENSDAASVTIPYKFSGSSKIDTSDTSRILVYEKKDGFEFKAPLLSANSITLRQKGHPATMQPYNPIQKFNFTQTAGLPGTDPSEYNTAIKSMKTLAVSKISAALASQPDSVNEQEIAVFVAEMAAAGKFNEAIDQVPESFKNGTRRTYFTAPFFNHLASMTPSLDRHISNLVSMTDNAISRKNLDIFTIDGISDFILQGKKTARIRNLLNMASSAGRPNLTQAVSILNVYERLYSEAPETAASLTPLTEICASIIEDNCSLNNEVIELTGFNTDVNQGLTCIQAGSALIEAGQIAGKPSWCDTGRLLVNKSLASASSMNFHTLASAYQILVKDNTFYPHCEILGYYGNSAAWAWTCASDISYKIDEENIVNINIDFPLSYSHYIIFKGIPTFHGQIEIQQQMFRTDSRFETYNSSGYVYLADSETLLIKSRHKSPRELIRLFCDPASNFSK